MSDGQDEPLLRFDDARNRAREGGNGRGVMENVCNKCTGTMVAVLLTAGCILLGISLKTVGAMEYGLLKNTVTGSMDYSA